MAHAARPPRKDSWWIVTAAILGIVAIVFLVAILGEDTEDEPRSTAALVACEQSVRSRLASPGSARFGDPDRAQVTGTNPFRVRSFVDSENAFGGLLRSRFSCTVTRLPDGNWRVTDVTLT